MDTQLSPDPLVLGSILRSGGIVIFPTETVYGIGANSLIPESCLKIYEIKNRPMDNPLICHFDSIERIEEFCELGGLGRSLLEKFSPGPLTLVLRKKVRDIFPFNIPTLACRIPKYKKVREMISFAGGLVSAPSANLSGRPSLTRLDDVRFYFEGKVDGILLDEEPEIGIESTVLDLTAESPVLLRPGSIEKEEILQLTHVLDGYNFLKGVTETSAPKSPGLKYRHYSPTADLILGSYEEIRKKLIEFIAGRKSQLKFAWIGFLPPGIPTAEGLIFSKEVSSNHEYRSELYAFFEACDRLGIQRIFCEIPKPGPGYEGLWNRLEKAKSKE
ncbi:MAG: L-threonylcarbamoyladenylate synthase [Leptospira sp.]|jgi:L-threonylcarbamoyladenylate synthase|nr:L-threonylcarbamoyladenylate synthase [Leptospira sp.]